MTNTKPKPQPPYQAALERLQTGVYDLLTSDGWINALKFRAQFHTYSFLNTLLIQSQCPTATTVAGYRKWQELGRQVRKGERGIRILAPMFRKDDEDPEVKVLRGYRHVSVFDISQTDGEPLPQPPRPKRLEGDSDLIQAVISSLQQYCMDQGIKLDWNLTEGRALGLYRMSDNSISLRNDLAPLQQLKTLVHELAHALLHDNPSMNRHRAELEAETTAFLTLQELGIDTSEYSFPYLAGWTDTFENLIAAGDNASKAATTLLAHIQQHLQPNTHTQPPTPSQAGRQGPRIYLAS